MTSSVAPVSKIATTKTGISASKSLTDDAATSIIDNAYDLSRGAGEIGRIEGKLTSELYENAMVNGLKDNIGKALNIADDEILDGVAKSTFDIVTKNNPDDAFSLLQIAASKIPLVRNTEWGPRLLGAMGYDGMIGLVLGTMRTGIQEIQRAQYNVAPDEYG